MSELGYCRPMRAWISPRQCNVNRDKHCFSCSACAGLEDVKEINLEEMVMSTPAKEPAPARKGRHLLCSVPGCEKIRARGKFCMAHYREAQAAKATPKAQAEERAVTPPPAKAGGRLSALLPPPETPARGYFLNMQEYPDLDAWLQERCPDDIPGAIIELLSACQQGRLQIKQ